MTLTLAHLFYTLDRLFHEGDACLDRVTHKRVAMCDSTLSGSHLRKLIDMRAGEEVDLPF